MIILLTNDDGINAAGLKVLDEELSRHHDVYVIAPAQEMSGISNAFTINRDIMLEKHDERHYALSAYPADCVNVGIHGDIIPPFDLVISGINHGPNMGDDTFFSGTVAGARTARIFKKNGIAVSVDTHEPTRELLVDTARFISNSLEELMGALEEPFLININYPNLPRNEVKGFLPARSSKRIYNDCYEKHEEGEGKTRLRLHGEISSEKSEGTDNDALQRGFVSLTPLTIDNSDYPTLDSLDKRVWQRKILIHE